MDAHSKENGKDGKKSLGCSIELQVINKMAKGTNKFKALRELNHKIYMETERMDFPECTFSRMVEDDIRDYGDDADKVPLSRFQILANNIKFNVRPKPITPLQNQKEKKQKKSCQVQCKGSVNADRTKHTLKYLHNESTSSYSSLEEYANGETAESSSSDSSPPKQLQSKQNASICVNGAKTISNSQSMNVPTAIASGSIHMGNKRTENSSALESTSSNNTLQYAQSSSTNRNTADISVHFATAASITMPSMNGRNGSNFHAAAAIEHIPSVEPSSSILQLTQNPPNRADIHGYTESRTAYVSDSPMNAPNIDQRGTNNPANNPSQSDSAHKLESSALLGSPNRYTETKHDTDANMKSYAIPDHLRLPCKPSKFVTTYRSIPNQKRSADTDINFEGEKALLPTKRNREAPEEPAAARYDFKTGTDELKERYARKYGNANGGSTSADYSAAKTLGARAGRTARSKFISPMLNNQDQQPQPGQQQHPYQQHPQPGQQQHIYHQQPQTHQQQPFAATSSQDVTVDERLKNIDPIMIERIQNEIMLKHSVVDWDSIAGLEYAKTVIKEAVIWPMIRPELFRGLRRPPKGILLFGPPGTGKTMIGKCIASQANATFFSISASSLTSKWIGEGEKMVRALFAVANVHQPSVIFIDEIDSLLCQRSDTEHESSRRLKTEFLVQLDGATTSDSDRVLIVGATNRPQELDEAARRRLVKRLYIPLPEELAREQMLSNLLNTENVTLTDEELKEIARQTDGYSGADMKALCSEAAMAPIRGISNSYMFTIDQSDVRSMNFQDLIAALRCVKATVSTKDLATYVEWDRTFGSGSGQ